jgi:hypothetical protein
LRPQLLPPRLRLRPRAPRPRLLRPSQALLPTSLLLLTTLPLPTTLHLHTTPLQTLTTLPAMSLLTTKMGGHKLL